MNLYDILGVAKDAGADEIKAAYRKLAQQHHPDKGGDKERFQQIQAAYEVLGDAEKRAEYDATGKVGRQGPTLREEAMEVVSAVIDEALECYDPVHDNILDKAAAIITGGLKKLDQQEQSLERQLEKVRKAMKRVAAKQGNQDALAGVMTYLEDKLVRPLESTKAHKAKCQEALKILREHDYTVDARPARDGAWSSAAFEQELSRAFYKQKFGFQGGV